MTDHEYPREPQKCGYFYYEKEGVSMSEKKKTPRVPLKEHLSEYEIKKLMGMFEPTHKRVNGKIKRK